jgi:hypothetical protein
MRRIVQILPGDLFLWRRNAPNCGEKRVVRTRRVITVAQIQQISEQTGFHRPLICHS